MSGAPLSSRQTPDLGSHDTGIRRVEPPTRLADPGPWAVTAFATTSFMLDEVIGDANPGTRIVVRPRFLTTRPEITAWRMSRSTRFRPTWMPSAMRSSAWMRRAPRRDGWRRGSP